MKNTKSCLAINDLSGFGKCSVTVALPILSCAEIETSVLPTAVLSNHTAFKEFTYTDLTDNMLKSAEIWKNLGADFDGIYSGFLGSKEQIDIVTQVFKKFRSKDNIILVDPVMGDNGSLYSTYTKQMADGMIKLCKMADIIVPNMTEAAYILGQEYNKGPYTEEYIKGILEKLYAATGCKCVVLTGVFFNENELGAACLYQNKICFAFGEKFSGMFHGTGDVFASAFFSSILNEKTVEESLKIAVDFTSQSIKNTVEAGTDPLFGVKFEQELPNLIKSLK